MVDDARISRLIAVLRDRLRGGEEVGLPGGGHEFLLPEREAARFAGAHDSSRCPAFGMVLDPDWPDRSMDEDRQYFVEHPGARTYVRPAHSDEHPFECAGVRHVEVLNVARGLRLRRELVP
jgi:hypothetical protein